MALICQAALACEPHEQSSEAKDVRTNARLVNCYHDTALLVLLFPAEGKAPAAVCRATKPVYKVLKDRAGQDVELLLTVNGNVIDKAEVLSRPCGHQTVRRRNLSASLRSLNKNLRDTLFDVFAAR
jgi:hypothetical protein